MAKRNGTLFFLALVSIISLVSVYTVGAWTPQPVDEDSLVRMPGTQPGQADLSGSDQCFNCHADYDAPEVEPWFNWQGSMMAQASRDFLMWACLTVAAQDSIWAIGTPNAVDICERCHFPEGWLEGRSDPPNASAMTGPDYDGVQCEFCHRMYDPFFETTYNGTREGDDWTTYWDETNLSKTQSDEAAAATYATDGALTSTLTLFNGNPFYQGNIPFSTDYTENGGGQYFVTPNDQRRASFADANASHQIDYSRYHKSKYFCSTCHDVSNPVLANLTADPTQPLTTELASAYAYYHVERTFSEFMLSDYGQQGGSAGLGPFAPGVFNTSHAGEYIASCQDCHMRDVAGRACDKSQGIVRPTESTEHPNSGVPLHDMTGGNLWVSYVLASAVAGAPNYDATNDALLNQGSPILTLDLSQGIGINPNALLSAITRTEQNLQDAAAIQNLTYDAQSKVLSFRIQNQTGHKLISGFPEGRRMFVNIQAYDGTALLYEINPYDTVAGTLKGLSYPYTTTLPAPGPLGTNETYMDVLVYEMHPSSSLTGEDHSFHFALADGRSKDNRIPPKGFRIAEASDRLSEPVWDGVASPDYFTTAEYAGGYDAVTVTLPVTQPNYIVVSLYYQTTSREYIEFLRDEINGTGGTLTGNGVGGDPPYIVQTDPFFSQLRAWGDTIWQLWTHNMNVPGSAPYLMTQATLGEPTNVTLVSFEAAREIQISIWALVLAGSLLIAGIAAYVKRIF